MSIALPRILLNICFEFDMPNEKQKRPGPNLIKRLGAYIVA